MKKTNHMEIIGVLSLSLLLTSTMSVSGCLPEMLKEFNEHLRSSVELLLSVPAFAMMVMIALSPILSKYINERIMVSMGLFIFGITGIIPTFFSSYEIILVSRILTGVGIGLVNARAVSMIGERFSGNLQQKLQGIRCSMETLGQATLTLVAGQLLYLGWNYSFLIYGIAFIILFLYLTFVPTIQSTSANIDRTNDYTYKVSGKEWKFIILSSLLGGLMVSASVMISLRIPSYIVESGIGTAVNGATILSISTFAGFLGGLAFGSLIKKLNIILLPLSMCIAAVGLIAITFAGNLAIMALGASLSSFFITNSMSYMFSSLPEHLPKEVLNTANAIVLVGCNLGSFAAPFILQAVALINADISTGFIAYAVILLIIAIGILLKKNLLKSK